jgi:hypothetical protein
MAAGSLPPGPVTVLRSHTSSVTSVAYVNADLLLSGYVTEHV